MIDTFQQKIAQSFDRSAAVIANAGSGKTLVLEKRYANILTSPETGAEPRSIAAITFTKKAAGEIAARVAKNIEKKIAEEKDPVEKMRLIDMRAKLSGGSISTIHSFCTELLRDHPIEAGLAPNFTELSEADKTRIKDSSILAAIEDRVESEDENVRTSAENLFDKLGRAKAVDFIEEILYHKQDFEKLKCIYLDQTEDEYIGKINAELAQRIADSLLKRNEAFSDILDGIDPTDLTKQKRGEYELAKAATENLEPAIRAVVSEGNLNGMISVSAALDEAVIKIFGKNQNNFLKDFKNASDSSTLDKVKDFISDFSSFGQLIDCAKNSDFGRDQFRLARELMEIALLADKYYEEEKSELQAIDFDDMLLKSAELLRDETTAEGVRSKFDFLMIDEFQDTDPLQYEIVKRLIPELDNPDSDKPSGINLFLVGDEKQSIYGFRKADVRVFKQARKDVARLNEKLLADGKLSRGVSTPFGIESVPDRFSKGDLELTASFRLLPTIASFANRIFSKIMADEGEFEVDYDPFVCGRGVDAYFEGSEPNPEESGAVEFLIAIRPKKGEEESEEHSTEAESIVARIKEIVAPNGESVTRKDGSRRPATCGDVAILSRRKKTFEPIVRELLKNGIPYYLASGSNYYGSTEIVDIFSYLKFVVEPDSDIALATVLKSPFFGLGDEELFAVAAARKKGSLWDKLNYLCDNEIEDSDAFREIRRTLLLVRKKLVKVSELAGRVPTAELISRMIDESAWRGAVERSPEKAQIIDNVKKLRELAASFDRKSFSNFYDFVDELELLVEKESDDGSATDVPKADVVKLFTIHASKGLEFPIVFIADCNSQAGKSSEILIDEHNGICFKATADKELNYEKKIDVPAFALARERKFQADSAEQKRLLYVAATRGYEKTIFTATLKKKNNGFVKVGGYFSMILEALDTTPEEFAEISSTTFSDELSVLKGKEIKTIDHKYEIKIRASLPPETTDAPTAKIEPRMPLPLLDQLPGSVKKVTFSPTALGAFISDGERYVRSYLLGMREEIRDEDEDEFLYERSAKIKAAEAGELIHQVLESIDEWYDGEIDENKLDKVVSGVLISVTHAAESKIAKRLKDECSKTASTLLLQKYADKIRSAEKEFELSLPILDHYLYGKIDMLIENDSGDREVWDWKSNVVDSSQKMDELANHYESQMKTYCFLLSKYFQTQENFVARLLFTRAAKIDAPDSDWTRKFEWSRSELIEYGKEIEGTIRRIEEIYI